MQESVAAQTEQDVKVEMTGISKSFGGVKALDDVGFKVRKGEIHALMGENGAGKSTLMKILSGAYHRDKGQIFIDGKEVHIASPKSGHDHGISVIYQEFALAPHLTVAENILIDNMGSGSPLVNWKRLRKKAQTLLDELGFGGINVSTKVGDLTVAYQQVVEICKAISRKCSVLVLDEPTAVLASNEVNRLFQLLRQLKQQGVSIIYVSHRINEIFEMCDRVSVLKDGKNVGTEDVKNINENKLVSMMIGRDLKEFFPARNVRIGDVVLKAENIVNGTRAKGISFELRKGEILGFSGLVGSGRSETMRAIFGADKNCKGDVYLKGTKVNIRTPRQAIRNKIGMLPEDRKALGVLLNMSVKVNATLSSIKNFSGFLGWIKKRKEVSKVKEMVQVLTVKTDSINAPVSSLSGGNQQKVSILKWLVSGSEVLIFDEPTRGVDVGAKVEIYKVMNQLAEEGAAIIMISSEMPEIIGMSDRAIVMREGVYMGELDKKEMSEMNLINLYMGVHNNDR
jgi:ribose transport system ATP-binding protein